MMLDRLDTLAAPAAARGGEAEEAYEAASADLRDLLREHARDVDRATALSLLAGHGRTEELLHYCRRCVCGPRPLARRVWIRSRSALAHTYTSLPSLPSFAASASGAASWRTT